ncbi:hypothetical protein [Conexibacter sp. S30A1]|jgi:hypothetical protein|uniref:hypothetical protein n=1 Tax=Conexibacter sp. S30A1 TaxID=2937800 RepID=UPI00200E8B8A|nr:hypothetical protein [Conexibacter sp. S30A1]
MATRTINLPLDEALVERVRKAGPTPDVISDVDAVERALAIYLGDLAIEAAQAAEPLDEDEAEHLAVEELHAMRRERRDAA